MDSAKFEDAAPAVSHIHMTTVRLRTLRRDAFLCSAEMGSLAGGAMIQRRYTATLIVLANANAAIASRPIPIT